MEVNKTALYITDSFKSQVNGISAFSHFFIHDVLEPAYTNVIVWEAGTNIIYLDGEPNNSVVNPGITTIYVNASFSKSDELVRDEAFDNRAAAAGLNVKRKDIPMVLISHGWTKIKPRFNYYNFYYFLRNFSRSRKLHRLQFYNRIIFISDKSDKYRHLDHLYAKQKNLQISYYDFSAKFINSFENKDRGIVDPIFKTGYVLTIGNFEYIKNLWSVIWFARKGKGKRQMVILVRPVEGFLFNIFQKLAQAAGVILITDQSQKKSLLQYCKYLFIPSYSEYNPVVALEAKAFGKQVLSLYKITALVDQANYHYLKD